MSYEFVEDAATADVLFRSQGKSLAEAFEMAAIALQEIMVDTSQVREEQMAEFGIKSEDLESLLFDYLSRFLVLLDIDHLVFHRVEVTIFSPAELHCRAHGETFDETRHDPRSDVKAITYHDMIVQEDPPFLQVLVDT